MRVWGLVFRCMADELELRGQVSEFHVRNWGFRNVG